MTMENAVFNFVFADASFPVRTVTIDNEPWFVAKDVCDALGIQNPTQVIERLDGDERSMFNIGRQGDTNLVSESGMYTLVLRCRQATTEGTAPHAFRKWVTGEVLPSIRKQEKYEAPKTLDDYFEDIVQAY
ncbi:hypothetical protein DQR71_09035 [Salmonella enterica subsp. enterica serovar Kingston]|nr:hypothetical protein [Salmonella enterica subsp. enterica serovar Kingston]